MPSAVSVLGLICDLRMNDAPTQFLLQERHNSNPPGRKLPGEGYFWLQKSRSCFVASSAIVVLALQNSDDIKTLSTNLGHETTAFTMDVYGHVSQTMREASASRMEKFISSL